MVPLSGPLLARLDRLSPDALVAISVPSDATTDATTTPSVMCAPSSIASAARTRPRVPVNEGPRACFGFGVRAGFTEARGSSAGNTGVGEVPGGERIRETLEDARSLVIGQPIGQYQRILNQMRSAFARPLVVEAGLLLVFGIFGTAIDHFSTLFVPVTVLLLCYIMGLQNAVITKVSHAEIRTTHVTGLLTDLGIELGKLFYLNGTGFPKKVVANRGKLRIHAKLVASFFGGALLGAFGFKHAGYIATVPLALLLLLLTWGPIADDLRHGKLASGLPDVPERVAPPQELQ